MPDDPQRVLTRRELRVLPAAGPQEVWTVELSVPKLYRISVRNFPSGPTTFEGTDFFEALCVLRTAVQSTGGTVLCAGARKDVFPSFMSRDMGGGVSAYLTRLGERGSRSDLVDIFDDAPADLVASVEDQLAFHQQWVASLSAPAR
jgi:hypothetical protein